MKVSNWIVIITVTFATAFAIGYVTGQQLTLRSSEIVDSNNTSIARQISVNSPPAIDTQSITAAVLSLNSTNNSPRTTDDILAKIDTLLVMLDENPKQTSSSIKLYAILEALSVDELLALGSSLKNKNESQRNMLSQFIIAQLIEKAPEKALAFAQRYNPMPDSPYYLAAIKAQVAEKIPELGFEYLNQMLGLANEDIDLSTNSRLIAVLAKADLKQLVSTLAKFQDMGIELENSLSLIAYGLKTNDEHLSVFNELRQLNDMSILSSVLINWMKISPTDVFERLNEIEDIAERKKLTDTAFHFWMLDTPEVAADHHLANASNKLEMLKKIMRIWPDKKASDALVWISAQSDIDTNRYKIDYLNGLSRSDPKFVESRLNEINLNGDEKIGFYQSLYKGFKRKSSDDAEQFLNTLPFKDEVLGITTEKEQSSDTRITKINKAFIRYFDFKYDKAFALATGDNGRYAYSYVVNKQSQNEANQQALSRCEQRRHKHNIESECKIYAEGDVIMFNLTP
jgi:hypothetical protein